MKIKISDILLFIVIWILYVLSAAFFLGLWPKTLVGVLFMSVPGGILLFIVMSLGEGTIEYINKNIFVNKFSNTLPINYNDKNISWIRLFLVLIEISIIIGVLYLVKIIIWKYCASCVNISSTISEFFNKNFH